MSPVAISTSPEFDARRFHPKFEGSGARFVRSVIHTEVGREIRGGRDSRSHQVGLVDLRSVRAGNGRGDRRPVVLELDLRSDLRVVGVAYQSSVKQLTYVEGLVRIWVDILDRQPIEVARRENLDRVVIEQSGDSRGAGAKTGYADKRRIGAAGARIFDHLPVSIFHQNAEMLTAEASSTLVAVRKRACWSLLFELKAETVMSSDELFGFVWTRLKPASLILSLCAV